MTTRLKTLLPNSSLEAVLKVLDAGLVALIATPDTFYGLITRRDVLKTISAAVFHN